MTNTVISTKVRDTGKELAVFKPTDAVLAVVNGAESHLEVANLTVVNSLETYNYADRDLKLIAGDLGKLVDYENKALEVLKPLVKERRDFFAKAKKNLKAASDQMKQKLKLWDQRQKAVAAAAQAEAMKAAQALRDEGTFVPDPVIVPATPKVGESISYRDNWVAEVFDMAALVRHIAKVAGTVADQNSHSLGWVMPNKQALDAIAKTIQNEEEIAPGVRIINDQIPISRR